MNKHDLVSIFVGSKTASDLFLLMKRCHKGCSEESIETQLSFNVRNKNFSKNLPAGVRPGVVAARVQLLPAVPADELQQLPPQLAGNASSRHRVIQVFVISTDDVS